MSEIDDGGPAFPEHTFQKIAEVSVGECKPGMSLRDYFAAAALHGMHAACNGSCTDAEDHLAEAAYRHADAMLKARKK